MKSWTEETIKIKADRYHHYSNLIFKNQKLGTDSLIQLKNTWSYSNEIKSRKFFQPPLNNLVIYSYSISNNLLKEAFSKIGIKFILTNNVRKASLIIGLKKSLKNNFELKRLAKTKNIPIYSFNQLSIYQLTKLINSFV